MPRRKAGVLVPLELEILGLALSDLRAGEPAFYGFGLARRIGERRGSSTLTAHGTLYKALGRLEAAGLLASRWEDADVAEGRPRRRFYELTDRGAEVAAGASSVDHGAGVTVDHAYRARPGLVPRPAPRVGTEPV